MIYVAHLVRTQHQIQGHHQIVLDAVITVTKWNLKVTNDIANIVIVAAKNVTSQVRISNPLFETFTFMNECMNEIPFPSINCWKN